jgi:uncharacterized membrane protein YkoI
MQVKNWMLASAVAAVLAACGNAGTDSDNKTDDSSGNTNSNSTTTTTETSRRTVEVPVATRTSFEAKYPQAKNVSWNYHAPASYNNMDVDWDWINWKLDTNDYYATFVQDNNDYWVWYDENGDWLGTISEVADYSNGLPPAVNATLKSQFAGYTVTSVDKENDKNQTAYEIQLENGANKMKALIAESGKVMKKKGTEGGEKVKEKNNPKDGN